MCVSSEHSLSDFMSSGLFCEVDPARRLTFETVDVFTDEKFKGGNPLAVVFGAEGCSTATLQRIAREFNYAEIAFVLPPEDPTKTARVRIFTPLEEYPFAGHPNVGTACVLARRGVAFGRPVGDALVFEEAAGDVSVEIARNGNGQVAGSTIAAPEPFAAGRTFEPADVAACLGLPADAVDALSSKATCAQQRAISSCFVAASPRARQAWSTLTMPSTAAWPPKRRCGHLFFSQESISRAFSVGQGPMASFDLRGEMMTMVRRRDERSAKSARERRRQFAGGLPSLCSDIEASMSLCCTDA